MDPWAHGPPRNDLKLARREARPPVGDVWHGVSARDVTRPFALKFEAVPGFSAPRGV